ncbi:MAG: hypothetical protein K2K63_01560 [Acetatifactor sp.]|nr:hypothetical protein [Acetatifactor sp.]
MKKKKLTSLLAVSLAAAMLLSGCGNDGNADGSSQQPSSSNPVTNNGGGEANNGGGETNNGGDNAEVTPSAPELTFAEGTVLRMACGYNNAKTGITFDPETAGEGITLADGVTYNPGDLKPTWVEVQNVLGMKFEDKFQGSGSDAKEWDYWKEQLDQVDMVNGTASGLTEAGVAGMVVDINQYVDSMPNFKAYLEENPIVRLSITGDTSTGAIYFSPYFDGVNDIERMPLMRVDWVAKLLDGEGEFAADKSGTTTAPVYQPYMPTSGKVDIDVVELDGKTVKTITKDYDTAGNIIANMNEAGSLSGVDAVNMLRNYIDLAYNGYYGTTRSNLFCGQNAAWDADELVALLRCVVSNAPTLNGTDTIQGLFSREDDNNQRRVDMFRFVGTLFGVRGLESRQDYLFVGNDGKLHDARQEAATYVALERMNALAQEGLISKSFMESSAEKTQTMLENDLGFMHYDYNQTQTIYNATVLDEGEKYMAVMVPVARWDDGTGEKFMRFTESWRSVKTGGWAISKAGVGDDTDKLNAALKLIDYAYSPEGQILMSYGPAAFRNDAKTFLFNGKEMPTISDAAYAELWDKANGNYTNYARMYLGSTLSFLKSQAFEYQCTHEVGREGAGYISTAIGLGTIKHPELAIVSDNMWYTSVPTVLPTTKAENDTINGFSELGGGGYFGQSKDQQNLFLNIIVGGFSGEGTSSVDETVATVTNSWNGAQYLQIKETAWQYLLQFYNSNN